MKANYHTHMYLCRHASGTTEDYVLEAIKHKLDVIGMSDHAPLRSFFFDKTVRMKDEDFSKYLESIKQCKIKYKNKIVVLAGLEVEYFSELHSRYDSFLQDLDYMILGQHYIFSDNRFHSSFFIDNKKHIELYGEAVVSAIKSGYFKIVAHPDVFMCGYRKWNETTIKISHDIIKAASDYNVVLELNANGIRRSISHGITEDYLYPYEQFWEIVSQYDVETIIGSDCHTPQTLNDYAIEKAKKIAIKFNLNLIDYIDVEN